MAQEHSSRTVTAITCLQLYKKGPSSIYGSENQQFPPKPLACKILGWLNDDPNAASITAICSRLLTAPRLRLCATAAAAKPAPPPAGLVASDAEQLQSSLKATGSCITLTAAGIPLHCYRHMDRHRTCTWVGPSHADAAAIGCKSDADLGEEEKGSILWFVGCDSRQQQ
jgi:hypothetical protein